MIEVIYKEEADGYKQPIGHKCKCGLEEMWPAYVYAHWNDPLRFTCKCGLNVRIVAGHVMEVEDGQGKANIV